MDPKTLKAYSQKAKDYSQDWLNQPEPSDMYELLQRYFIPGGKAADIGCGSGRDANWLAKSGFQVTGFDASTELVSEARKLNASIPFKQAVLPSLDEIQEQFDNVLCETVIMHLPKEQIPEAILNLKRIVKSGGVLYLSWRVTEGEDQRHKDGRLYSAFQPNFILNHFTNESVLHLEDKTSQSSLKRICRVISKGA